MTIKKKQISANYRKINQTPVIPKTQGLTMGVLITGGIGDYIQATRTVKGLIRKFYPDYVEIYTHPYNVKTPNTSDAVSSRKAKPSANAFRIFDDIVEVSQVTDIKNSESSHRTTQRLRPHYDIWADLRYISKIYLSEKAETSNTARTRCYRVKRNLPRISLAVLSRKAKPSAKNNCSLDRLGKNLMELRDLSLEIETSPNDMTISIRDADIEEARSLIDDYPQFICIHNGTHPKCTTKLWLKTYWEELVEMINKTIYLPVLQIGIEGEQHIKGTINLLGKTTIQSATLIAASSPAYIDTEGGIVHARRALTLDPAIVLFGATSHRAFGYDENINISANVCEPCWWKTAHWGKSCMEGKDYECMNAITPKRVFNAVISCIYGPHQAGEFKDYG